MRRRRGHGSHPFSRLAFLLFLFTVGLARGGTLDQGLERLRSADEFDRQRGEQELRRLGVDSLVGLAAAMEEATDRLFRFRTERIFSENLETLLVDLDSAHQASVLEQNEIRGFKARQEAAEARKELKAKLEEQKLLEPQIEEKLEDCFRLERLEERAKQAQSGEAPALSDEAREDLGRLRKMRADWEKKSPRFQEELEPILKMLRLQKQAAEGGDLTELEVMRLKELEERLIDRLPKVEKLVSKVEQVGLPALNGLLARRLAARDRVGAYYGELVSKALEKLEGGLFPGEDSFDRKRYGRSLLWAWEIDTKGPRAKEALAALERHLTLTLNDREDPQHVIKERAADELYLLGPRGKKALEDKIGRDPAGSGGDHFLLGLLRWRIRPRTYAKVGIHFEDYPSLSFRDRRKTIFEYAQVAGDDAIPTLRAIVTDDSLEPSFLVKMAAAKALAGLRDMSGYNHLIIARPDLTLKKPEVSRELLIIQGLEYIRDKNYQQAVEEFRKLLEEFPFDFQANYHVAFAYLLLKNYAKSIHYFEIARRINPQDQLTLYNLACAYALAGKKNEALEALEASVSAGFDDYRHIERDPDLDSLRKEPAYQRLIEKMKGGSKEGG